MPEVTMPRLSDSMEEGTIIKWLKSDGDEVARGDELVEIETDKANMTYEADQGGTLEIVASEGDTLPIGEVIARIGGGGGSNGAKAEPQESDAAPEAEEDEDTHGDDPGAEDGAADATPSAREEPRRAEPSEGEEDNGRLKASPVARRMARELGLDLAGVEGSGPGGRIVKSDVEALKRDGPRAPREDEAPATEAPAGRAAPAETGTAKGDVTIQELTRTQQTVARRMAESKATVPDFTLTADVDMSRGVAARAELKAALPEGAVVPSFNDLVVKACALALRDFPRANGAYRDGHWEVYSRVNVGVAVAADDALVVPTIFDADRRTLGEIAVESRKLAARVRDRTITPPELAGGTFTVSNLGMFGVTSFTAVINPPQAAILAVGAIRAVPVVRDGALVPGHVMSMTLACDHRILYGAEAAEFLARVVALLERPMALAL